MLIFPWKVRCKPGKTSLCKRGSTAFKSQGFTSNNIFLELLLHPLPVQVALQSGFPPRVGLVLQLLSSLTPSCQHMLPQSQQQESSVSRISHQISNVGTVSDACHCPPQHTAQTSNTGWLYRRATRRCTPPRLPKGKKKKWARWSFTVSYSGTF